MTESSTAGRVLRSLAPTLVEVAVPLAVFLALRALGTPTFWALVGGGSSSVVALLVTVVRSRRLSATSLLVAALIAVGLAVTFATHDPRILPVKASAFFAVTGVTMLLSCLGRPMFYGYIEAVAAGADPHGRARFAAAWDGSATFRHLLRRMTVVWGVAWLVESAVRVVVVYSFPPEDAGRALLWSLVALPVVLVPAMVLSSRDGRRLQRVAEAFHARAGCVPASA